MNETEPVPTHQPAPTPAQPRPRRTWWIWLLVLVLAAAGAAYMLLRPTDPTMARGGRGRGGWGGRRGFMMIPPSVSTVPAAKGDLHIFLTAIGSVTPLNTVTVKSRAVGQLQKIYFTEGQFVKEGDLLAEIDPRPYEAALSQAEGQLARDQALLANARQDLDRYQNAAAAVTQQQVDTAKAAVAQYEGAVRADQGSVDNDRLQLSFCRITAPLSGRVGLKLVDQGNLIQSGDATGIVVITQEQPMSVIFSVPEDDLPQVYRAFAHGRELEAIAYDRAGNIPIATGHLTAIDNQIDAATGTVKLRALYPNEDHALFPNQFVNVRLILGVQRDATLVPNSAILIGAQTSSVFVVKSDNTVEQRVVKLGRSEDERTAIVSGLQPGEVVAADGLDKLQDGGPVVPHPLSANGKADENPAPVAQPTHRWPRNGQGNWSGKDGGQGKEGGQWKRHRPGSETGAPGEAVPGSAPAQPAQPAESSQPKQ